MSQKKQSKEEILQKQQQLREITSALQQIKGDSPSDRQTILAPPQPEKSYSNPDGIHDVITFCEHPYFLNQRLTPWQKIILKLFYQGTYGNNHLKIEEEVSDTCKGCIWEKNCKPSEERSCQAASNTSIFTLPKAYMHVKNSPCLHCQRFDPELRDLKSNFLITHAISEKIKQGFINIFEQGVKDNYRTEKQIFDDEIEDPEVHKQIERKMGQVFQELILVLGRRSGKSYMVSVIALYEVYKLISMGHPQARYPIMEFDTINILNVANSEEQAKGSIFDKIKGLVNSSPFFTQHLGREPTNLSVWFVTPYDKDENARRAKQHLEPLEGTIRLTSGHSNSATQVGGTIICVIIDEMAVMTQTETSSNDLSADDDLYTMLKPSLATFGEDGKMICISNPLGPSGKFYKLYKDSFEDDNTLMIQLPTWLSNPTIDPKILENEKKSDPANFEMHYGARFGSSGQNPFFQEIWIDEAFTKGHLKRRQEYGIPHVQYFAHLDPAQSSDYYTLVILHLEESPLLLGPDGKPKKMIVVDHMHYWIGDKKFPIDSNEVDDYILNLKVNRGFNFAQISYDQWGSMGSINKLKTHGLNLLKVSFTHNYQNLIWTELYELFLNGLVEIYDVNTIYQPPFNPIIHKAKPESLDLREVDECKKELKTLQKKWRNNQTFKVEALAGNHDDFCDCLAAAAYEALKFKSYEALPRPVTVYTGRYLR